MKAWQESALRVTRRIFAEPVSSEPVAPLEPPAISLDEAAASGQLCDAGGHHWDRLFDHTWKCRRCGELTRSEKP